jgi:hypothetical protein
MSDSLTLFGLKPLAAQGPSSFARALGGWALVGQVPDASGEWSYRTGSVTPARSVRAVRGADGDLEAMLDLGWSVFVVKKAPGNTTFGQTVLIGRASTNDIVLPHASVSKLHARIQLSRDGLVLSDAGSSNGTIVNGDQLRDGEEVGLASSDLLRFGSIAVQVFSPEQLCSVLSRVGS